MFKRSYDFSSSNKKAFLIQNQKNLVDLSLARRKKKSLSKTKTHRMFDFSSTEGNQFFIDTNFKNFGSGTKNQFAINLNDQTSLKTKLKYQTPKKKPSIGTNLSERNRVENQSNEIQERREKRSVREKAQSSAMKKYFQVFHKNMNVEENTTKLPSDKSKEEILEKLKRLQQQSEINQQIKENQQEQNYYMDLLESEKKNIKSFEASINQIQLKEEEKELDKKYLTETKKSPIIQEEVKKVENKQQKLIKNTNVQSKVQINTQLSMKQAKEPEIRKQQIKSSIAKNIQEKQKKETKNTMKQVKMSEKLKLSEQKNEKKEPQTSQKKQEKSLQNKDKTQVKKQEKTSKNQFWKNVNNQLPEQPKKEEKMPRTPPPASPKNKKIKTAKNTQSFKKQYCDEIQQIEIEKPKPEEENEKPQQENEKFQDSDEYTYIEEIRDILYLIDTIGDYPKSTKQFYEKLMEGKLKNTKNYKLISYLVVQQFYHLRKKATQILKEKNVDFFTIQKKNLKKQEEEIDETVKELQEENQKCKMMIKKYYNNAKDQLPQKQRVFSIDHQTNHHLKCLTVLVNEFKEIYGYYKVALKSDDQPLVLLERLCYIMQIYFLMKYLNGQKVKQFEEVQQIKDYQAHFDKWKHFII